MSNTPEQKTFGQLLQESLNNREAAGLPAAQSPADATVIGSPEPVLTDAERAKLLEKLQDVSSPIPSHPVTNTGSADSTSKIDLSSASFGDLLKMSLDERKKVTAEDDKEKEDLEEVREVVLQKTEGKIGLIDEMLSRLMH